MNKKVISSIILFTFSWLDVANAIKMPWYHTYFHRLNGINYNKNCNLINKLQKIHHTALLTFYRVIYRKKNLDKVINLIKNQLKEFDIWFACQEQKALLAIKEKYNVNDTLWEQLLTDIKELKKIYINEMSSNHDTVHDQNIPTEIHKILITLLEQNNINPRSVHLIMIADQKEIDKHRNVIARAKSFIEKDANGPLSISRRYIPSRIEIFPRADNSTTIEKVCYCAHEIQHLLQHHGIIESILATYLNHYRGIEITEFETSPEYLMLSKIYEAQAEIVASTNNSHVAASFKAMRSNHYYPDHLYEEHFFHLSTIDTLWKIHDKLELLYAQGNDNSHYLNEKRNNFK